MVWVVEEGREHLDWSSRWSPGWVVGFSPGSLFRPSCECGYPEAICQEKVAEIQVGTVAWPVMCPPFGPLKKCWFSCLGRDGNDIWESAEQRLALLLRHDLMVVMNC